MSTKESRKLDRIQNAQNEPERHYVRDDAQGNVAYWYKQNGKYHFHSHSDDGMAVNNEYDSFADMLEEEPALWADTLEI